MITHTHPKKVHCKISTKFYNVPFINVSRIGMISGIYGQFFAPLDTFFTLKFVFRS